MSLDGSACEACGRAAVPAEPACLVCASATSRRALRPEGTVLAWTRPSTGRTVALVELEAGARAMALHEGEITVAVGMPVALVDDGGLLRFSPVEG